jgi:hypothetical protein
MKHWIISIILLLTQCVTVDENFEGRSKPIGFSICFWNAEKLTSKKISEWTGRKNYLTELTKQCDSISLIGLRTDNDNISTELESFYSKDNLNYSCADSFPRLDESNQILNHTKYTTCVNRDKVVEMIPLAYPEARNDFVSPPTFFFLELTNGAKVSVLPFHANIGSKSELIDFEKVVNFAYQKYSERKFFFGGDFYTDKKYHTESFLKSLLYFQILKNLIAEPTTFAGEKNDIIFTDKITQLNCIGKILSLDKFPSVTGGQKDFETVTSHLPVMASCKIR